MMRRYKTNPKTWMQYHRDTDGTLKSCYVIPIRSRPSQYGWTEANRFSYYWDAGLLTACKESRAARLYHQHQHQHQHHLDRNTETTTVQRPQPNTVTQSQHTIKKARMSTLTYTPSAISYAYDFRPTTWKHVFPSCNGRSCFVAFPSFISLTRLTSILALSLTIAGMRT